MENYQAALVKPVAAAIPPAADSLLHLPQVVSEPKAGCEAPVVHPTGSAIAWKSNADAASFWYKFGFTVVPIVPNTEETAVTTDLWLSGLSTGNIARHWFDHPDHDVGFIPGDDIVVLKGDSADASRALYAIERKFDALPTMATQRGKSVCHYFRREKSTYVQFGTNDACKHKDAIDIKTGHAVVLLPPSSGNTSTLADAKNAGELIPASQDVIDAVYRYNGLPPPRPIVCDAGEAKIKPCDTEIIAAKKSSADEVKVSSNPLDKFSLRGMSQEIERQAVEAVPVIGQLALKGQATLVFGAPNAGKTVITLALLIEAITSGCIDSSKVYYINVDDTGIGLAEKNRIAEEYGFTMMSEGYNDFKASKFLSVMADLMVADKSKGIIVVLDTLTKFVDSMDKSRSREFTNVIRHFILKGGTFIALAHTNKNLGPDGKPVYAGVSDFLNNVDCAYILAEITKEAGNNEMVVEFVNKKRRGNVLQSAAYSYSVEHGISYSEILASVQAFDAKKLAPLKLAEQSSSDAETIRVVGACIKDGVNTKMKLADAVAKRANVSRRSAIQIIERYTGNDPAIHRWTYFVRERGAKEFVILDSTPSVAELEGMKP